MAEAIQNPRRVPRAPARCEARCLLPGGGFWASDTADFGPKGCQLHAPGPFKRSDPVKLVITSERVPEPLATTGTVAWASPRPPWRIGISFDEAYLGATGHWFDLLVKAYPGLATFQLAPEKLALGAELRLGPPPRVKPELIGDEVVVLRAVGEGTTVAGLRERLGAEWPACEGLLFSMIGKKLLTLDVASAGSMDAWAPWLASHP